MERLFIVSMLIIIALVMIVSTSFPAYAWDDCPKGLVNDPAPGRCEEYVDTDRNGICDRSEPAPENRLAVVTTATTTLVSTPETAPTTSTERSINGTLPTTPITQPSTRSTELRDIIGIALLTLPITIVGILLLVKKIKN